MRDQSNTSCSASDGPSVALSAAPSGVPAAGSLALKVAEGSPLNLSCLVDAVPPVDPRSILWTINGAGLQGVSGSVYMVAPAVQRAQAALYGCTASNRLSPSGDVSRDVTGSAVASVDVQCG